MFVDLVNCTEIAQLLGHVKYHRFIHKAWCDITEPILDAKGDIYKYVGDEVIVTWLVSEARLDNCWLECFFTIKEKIKQENGVYQRMFGVAPEFRAALHCGTVVAGEMGDYKREVGFIGDTVNVTARILEACKAYKCDFLASGDVLQRTAHHESYKIQEIGQVRLRGREGTVALYAVAMPSHTDPIMRGG